MASTYTYDPSMITLKGKDQMRFALGDTVIQGGNMTTARDAYLLLRAAME